MRKSKPNRKRAAPGTGKARNTEPSHLSKGTKRPKKKPNDVSRRHKVTGKPTGEKRKGRAAATPLGAVTETMRIAKAIARAGLCSRRDAEKWIADGRVSINGQDLDTPARDVGPQDKILVDGHPLPMTEPVQLWRYHKPKGLLTTHKSGKKKNADGSLARDDRETVFDNLPKDLPRVISVGRLDFNTEGLLLLTNDGALARYLELPSTGWLRRYRVRAKGRITQEKLNTLADGLTVDNVNYGPITATLDSTQGANTWLTIALREGKNREVRKIMSALGLDVNRLIRISYGPFQLLDLKPGRVEHVKRRVLREQLNHDLCLKLGLNEDNDEKSNTIKNTRSNIARKKSPKKPHKKTQNGATRSKGKVNRPHRGKKT